MNPGDRKIMQAAGALLVLLTVIAVISAPAPEGQISSFPSSYAATAGGARAAFMLVERMGMRAQRWEEPPFNMDTFAPLAAAVFAAPTEKPSHAEREALKRFVHDGGRVLFCGQHYLDFFPELIPEQVDKRIWATTYGSGQIIRWRTAQPLTNANLKDHLPIFLNSVGLGTRQYVLWDEYFHGERGGLLVYMSRVPAIRWAVVPAAILLFATLFTYSRRSGPVISPMKVSRLSPLEFVESLGILYRKAKSTAVPVEVNARELRLQLARRLALPADMADAELAQQAALRLGWNEEDLLRALTAARDGHFDPVRALDLVRQLKSFTANLAR